MFNIIFESSPVAVFKDHDLEISILIDIIAFHQIGAIAYSHDDVFTFNKSQLNLFQF